MKTIKCSNCGIINKAHKEITSGLKIRVLTSICKCGKIEIEYMDKFYLIPRKEKLGILSFYK